MHRFLTSLLLLILLVRSAHYTSSADDPQLINHKHRRRSVHNEKDPRTLQFRFVFEPSNTIVSSPDGSALLHCKFSTLSSQNLDNSLSESDEETDILSTSYAHSSPAQIVTRVEWRKDGSPIHPVGRMKLLSNGSLLLDNVMPGDEGQYQCAVHIAAQQAERGVQLQETWVFLSRRAALSLPSLHRFEQHPSDRHARIGQMTAFRCLLDSKPPARIEWYHDNQPLKHEEDGYFVLNISQTLEIVNVQLKHAGVYKCVARNGERSRTSQLGILTVLEGEDSPQSMNWVLEPRSQLISVGDSAILECLANNGGARQTTKIQWLHNSEPISPEDYSKSNKMELIGKRKTHLLIRNVSSAEAGGTYTCRAESQRRTQDSTATVAVRVPPKITVRPRDVLTHETNDVEFECVAEGMPTPRITWFKNGEVIIPSEYFVIASNKLRIFGLVRDDQGVYQCIADNEVGSEQVAAQLLVDQAEILSSYYSLLNRSLLHNNSNPIPDDGLIGPLENAQNWAIRRRKNITSHLPLVSAPSATSATAIIDASSADKEKPLQPLSLRVTEVRAQSVLLSWDPPLQHQQKVAAAPDIAHYIVHFREEGSTRERSMNSTGTELTLQGLQPATVYAIKVSAMSRAGAVGRASDPLSVTTKKQEMAESLPGKVRNLRAEVLSSESIQVDWNEPAPVDPSSNSDLRYKLFYSKLQSENNNELEQLGEEDDEDEDDEEEEEEEDEGAETQVLMLKTSYTLHGMAKNARYAIRLEAENGHGTGPSSDSLLITTWPDSPSASPQDVRLEQLGPDTVRVRWSPPPKQQWNGPLTGYKLRHKIKGGGRTGGSGNMNKANTIAVDGADERAYTLQRLESGSTYMVRVAAVNQNGTGPWTDWAEIETPEEQREESQIAGAPSELRVQAAHDSVLVSWLPPRDDNVLIRGYLVGWGISIPDIEKANVDSAQRQFTIRGLKPNREYVISLRAFNKVGHGFPIYETVKTSSYGHSSSSSTSFSLSSDQRPSTFGEFGGRDSSSNNLLLMTPVGVVAEAVSSSQIRLSWTDPNEHAFNQLYTVKYGLSGATDGQYKLLNTSDTEHTFSGLNPDSVYEFAVRLASSGGSPHQWSLNAINRTLPAPPSSPPRDLTLIGPQPGDEPETVQLAWQPPKYANGEIQEYIVLYSDRPDVPERDWVMDSVRGDRLSIGVRKLHPSRTYHFKLQARNVKGYGPFSAVVSFSTVSQPGGGGAGPFDTNGGSRDEQQGVQDIEHLLQLLGSNLAFVLIGVVAVILLLLAVALLVACFQRTNHTSSTRQRASKRQKRNNSRRAQQPYIPGRQMSATPPLPPTAIDDLWIHHQQNNIGGGGSRFAALVNNTSAVEDYDMASAAEMHGGILLIDGQQRAFIAPGTNNGPSNVDGSPTLPRYQAFHHHAMNDQRQGKLGGSAGGAEDEYYVGRLSLGGRSCGGGNNYMTASSLMAESFHSAIGYGSCATSPPSSPKKIVGNRQRHNNNRNRNSLPPRICPHTSVSVSPMIGGVGNKHGCGGGGGGSRSPATTTTTIATTSSSFAAPTITRHKSDSPPLPTGDSSSYCSSLMVPPPPPPRVATVRMNGSRGLMTKLNALEQQQSSNFLPSAESSPCSPTIPPKMPTAAGGRRTITTNATTRSSTSLATDSINFQLGIGLPSLGGLQVKEAKLRVVNATANNGNGNETALLVKSAPIKSVNFASKLVIVSENNDDVEEGEEDDAVKNGRSEEIAFIDDAAEDDDEKERGEAVWINKQSSASVGTLPRNFHHNHHQHHHNSANSLEMKAAAPPFHAYHHNQQQQLTPATPRNAHVVYTRVDRQPIAKVDFCVNGVGAPPSSSSPYQFCGGTPPPPPPLNSQQQQHEIGNRNSGDGYQTVRGMGGGGTTATVASSMRSSFVNSENGSARLAGGDDQAVPGDQPPKLHQQQQRTAHVVRPIVYAAGGTTTTSTLNGGGSPSPAALRSAIGGGQTTQQLQHHQQKTTTPTIGHKFSSSGAKVPVGRATAQPRVNLASAGDAASSIIQTMHQQQRHSSSPYSSVRVSNGSGGAGDIDEGGKQQIAEDQFKSIGSTEDLQEIDQMIETLQQLQQDFTENNS